MTAIRSRQGYKEVTIRAVVTRADGTIEDRGVISYRHKNPLRRLAYKLGRLFKWLQRS